MIGLSKKQKDTLEYSFLEFENKQFDKIEKAITKYIEKNDFNNPLSLTESILFPSELRKEIISSMRMFTNEQLYQSFKSHDMFDKISLKAYNIDYIWEYRSYLSESIFIDSFMEIDNVITYYYNKIKNEFNKIGVKVNLKSQGIIFNENEEKNNLILSNSGIFYDSFFDTIRHFMKEDYLFRFKFSFISNKDNSFITFYNTPNGLEFNENDLIFNTDNFYNIKGNGHFNNFKLLKDSDDNLKKEYFNGLTYFLSKLIKSNFLFIKENKDVYFSKKEENSKIYIPKNKDSRYINDFGYFSEESFKNLIIESNKKIIGFEKRTTDFNFMINNFKIIS